MHGKTFPAVPRWPGQIGISARVGSTTAGPTMVGIVAHLMDVLPGKRFGMNRACGTCDPSGAIRTLKVRRSTVGTLCNPRIVYWHVVNLI